MTLHWSGEVCLARQIDVQTEVKDNAPFEGQGKETQRTLRR
jgi:hypothetical protein